MRKKFEAWYSQTPYEDPAIFDRSGACAYLYLNHETEIAWQAWQEALAQSPKQEVEQSPRQP